MKELYCHFSFKRPKGKGYGYFAVAFYKNNDDRKCVYHITKKKKLWEDHQFITGIQAYENALSEISKFQVKMLENGIDNILLVTDNTTLAGWIMEPNKNKYYKHFMERAVNDYKSGAPREINIGVGLCSVQKYEKSYKYCKERYIVQDEEATTIKKSDGKNVIGNIEYKTIYDIENDSIPNIEIEEI